LLKPILEEKSKKTEEIMKIIEVETEEAEKQKEIVSKDEEITEEKA
jgi:dynein heavy chain